MNYYNANMVHTNLALLVFPFTIQMVARILKKIPASKINDNRTRRVNLTSSDVGSGP